MWSGSSSGPTTPPIRDNRHRLRQASRGGYPRMARLFAVGLAVAIASIASAGRAFADTVDAAAQPYMVAGGFIAGAIFIGGGLYTIWVGRDRRRIARESPNWPQADGKILTATVATRWHPTVGSYYVPRAYYSYAVAVRILPSACGQFG